LIKYPRLFLMEFSSLMFNDTLPIEEVFVLGKTLDDAHNRADVLDKNSIYEILHFML
jgi:hypothetical protein